jgi:hypothetical protein
MQENENPRDSETDVVPDVYRIARDQEIRHKYGEGREVPSQPDNDERSE